MINIPSVDLHGHVDVEQIFSWYLNIEEELKKDFLSKEQKQALVRYYDDAGVLDMNKRQFFKYHYANSLYRTAAKFLDNRRENKLVSCTLLDLGCGLGTQSIFFALLGFNVIAVDFDSESLDILDVRKRFYERVSGNSLNIQTYRGDAFNIPYKDFGPIHGLYSIFAFNMMQPSKELLKLIMPALQPGAVVSILDGNNSSIYNRLFRKRDVLSPQDLSLELNSYGFKELYHRGGISFPPNLWKLPVALLDSLLNETWCFPISHHLIAQS